MTDPARNKFMMLSLVRLAGAVFIVIGFGIQARHLWGLPGFVGIVLMLVGLFGYVIAPRLLVRRWRTPE